MITIEINDGRARRVLARLEGDLSDMTPIMRDLGDLLVASTQDRVARGEQPDGAPFAPRAPSTLAHYQRLGLSFGAPLNRSGVMRQNIAFAAGADFVEISSNEIQSAVMQFGARKGAFGATSRGAPIPWGDIPARPFIGLSDEDEVNMVAEIEEWLARSAGIE